MYIYVKVCICANLHIIYHTNRICWLCWTLTGSKEVAFDIGMEKSETLSLYCTYVHLTYVCMCICVYVLILFYIYYVCTYAHMYLSLLHSSWLLLSSSSCLSIRYRPFILLGCLSGVFILTTYIHGYAPIIFAWSYTISLWFQHECFFLPGFGRCWQWWSMLICINVCLLYYLPLVLGHTYPLYNATHIVLFAINMSLRKFIDRFMYINSYLVLFFWFLSVLFVYVHVVFSFWKFQVFRMWNWLLVAWKDTYK
jgi:hypothetical protein